MSSTSRVFQYLAFFLAIFFLCNHLKASEINYSSAYAYQPPASYRAFVAGKNLTDFTNEYNLNVSSRFSNNRIELFNDKGNINLTIIPGMSTILYNGNKYALSCPPVFSNGTLVIPTGVMRLLPKVKEKITQKQYRYDENFKLERINSSITVILDPGHGGRDPGATGRRGLKEKDVNLNVGLYTREFLRSAGVRVVMTRSSDRFLSLNQRAGIANRTHNSIFVSIHANAAKDRSAKGIETFVLSDNISNSYRSRKAAANYDVRKSDRILYGHGKRVAIDKICREARKDSVTLASFVQKASISLCKDHNRGVRSENLHVLRESYFAPAVLVEVGFLSNAASERKLKSNNYQRKLAYGISCGIVKYLKSQGAKDQAAWMRHQDITIASR